jgi:hypothetical protein
MRTRNITLLTLLVLLATSCMPDSFTKFKEEAPSKKSASGGTSGSSSTPTPTPTPVVSTDVVYEITSVEFYQSQGDTYLFSVLDGTGYSVGDQVNLSEELFYSSTLTYNYVGTITAIHKETNPASGSDDERILAVKLDGAIEIGAAPIDYDYDGNFVGFDASYASDTAIGLRFIDEGFYIDNCSTGYGSCALGTFSVSVVGSKPVLYISPSIPVTSPFTNAPLKSISKRIHVIGNGVDDAKDLTFDYTLGDGTLVGLGVRDGVVEAIASNGIASDDRLVSPFGPFTMANDLNFFETPLSVTVSLNSADFGTALDTEESATGELYFATTIPGTAVEDIQEFELTYYLENNQRFAVQVDNVSGFVAGLAATPSRNIIRACKVTIGTACDTDNESPVGILGKAQIDYIDEARKIIYLTALDFDHNGNATANYPSLFKEGLFLHNGDLIGSSSTFVTAQTSKVFRLFNNLTAGETITPEWNVPVTFEVTADNQEGVVVFSVDNFPPSGFSIDPGTGIITMTTPGHDIDRDITITVTDAGNGGVIDSFALNISSITAPTGLDYSPSGATTASILTNIGDTDTAQLHVITSSGAGTFSSTNIDFSAFSFTSAPALPTGATIDNSNARITWSPTDFNTAATSYTISATFPAYDPSTSIGSVTANFGSTTKIDKVVFPQNSGDTLILRVNDASQFSTAAGSNRVSTPDGAVGTVNFVDEPNNRIFITVNSNLTGNSVFKAGDSVDKTASFIIERTKISPTSNAVVHVFDIASTAFSTGNNPSPFLNDGTAVTLGTGETLSYAVTPNAPSDMTFSSTTGGFTAVSAGNLGNLSETVYTIAATNGNGNTVLSDYAFTVIESPTLASMNRYQFVRISGNGNRFYRGSRVQTDGPEFISGRVLMKIDTDGDDNIDGLLLENNGDIPDGKGLDNTAVFFSAKLTVLPYQFWYVKDVNNFTVAEQLTSVRGDQATVEARDATNNRLYVRVNNGTFITGDVIEDGSSNSSTIKSIEDRHYVTGAIEVSSADFAAFLVGGPITYFDGATTGTGVVVQKHIDNNNTVGIAVDERYYLLIQHVSGPLPSEGETIENSYTFNAGSTKRVLKVVGPIIDLTINGGASAVTSSGRVDEFGNPFFEGNLIGEFVRAGAIDGQHLYKSVGYATYGTDYTANQVTVMVEDFFNHFSVDTADNNFIDDFTESVEIPDAPINSAGESTPNGVTGVRLSNLIVSYVGEPLHLEPSLKGEFNLASISPETLPAGLTFDSTTGVISGIPTNSTGGATYTISFRTADGTGTASYSFPFIIYNQFEIAQTTEQASSYVIHKEGQSMGSSRCKVISPQLIDDVNDPNYNQAIYGLNDIICVLEGGESDIYNRGISFDIKYGAGMCEYVQYVPYSYQSFLPGASNRFVTTYNAFPDSVNCNNGDSVTISGTAIGTYVANANLAAGSAIPIASRTYDETYCDSGSSDCAVNSVATNECIYDYSQVDPTYPNMDTGVITARTVNCTYTASGDSTGAVDGGGNPIGNGTPDEVTCACDVAEVEINCAGETINGLAGAKHYSGINIANEGSKIMTTVSGGNSTEVMTPPINRGYGSNRSLANFISSRNYAAAATNSCYASNFHMDSYSASGTLTSNRNDWENYSGSRDPFGMSNSGLYNNFYTFNCLDAAFDIKARIRVLVRDWDREFTPEDHALTNLASNSSFPVTPTISTTASSNIATLSGVLGADLVLGYGTTIYVDTNNNSNLDLDGSDEKFTVVSYVRGTTTVTLNRDATTTTAPLFRNLFIRSKVNDEETNSFGVPYDNFEDFDSDWLSLLTDPDRPNYTACGNGNNETVAADTITLTAGSRTGTLTGANAMNLQRGTVIEITSGGVTFNLMVMSQSGSSITLASPAPMSVTTNAFSVVNNIPYSAEKPN